MNRRGFFVQLASGLVILSAPKIFVPKLIKPVWKRNDVLRAQYSWHVEEMGLIISGNLEEFKKSFLEAMEKQIEDDLPPSRLLRI